MIASSLVGTVIIGAALRDVFHTLLHPAGHGGISSLLCRLTWLACRRLGRHGRVIAGPLGVLVVIATWLSLMMLGFALVLLPLVPHQVVYGSGSNPGSQFVDALYLSGVTISTLGFGDVVIQDPVLRWLSPVEALLGFGVLTAAITWITQIYPALSRRRSLALHVWTALNSSGEGRPSTELEVVPATISSWTARLSEVEVDLIQNAETFWFRESDDRLSLATALVGLRAIAKHCADKPEGQQLGRTLAVVSDTLTVQYGHLAQEELAFPTGDFAS